jgi:hypothetical protein
LTFRHRQAQGWLEFGKSGFAGVAAASGFAGSIRYGSIIAFSATIHCNFIG